MYNWIHGLRIFISFKTYVRIIILTYNIFLSISCYRIYSCQQKYLKFFFSKNVNIKNSYNTFLNNFQHLEYKIRYFWKNTHNCCLSDLLRTMLICYHHKHGIICYCQQWMKLNIKTYIMQLINGDGLKVRLKKRFYL